jgi:CubicO group peptidase (beta-lactamase class C family)
MVRQICEAPAAWEPGTAAGYHGTSAHVILGELVRIVDGRPSRNSRRVFGSSGAFSSVGFADPEVGLACVIITNGLVDLDRNQARLGATADAVNDATRRPGRGDGGGVRVFRVFGK